jgi:hypothetical protein
MAQLCPSCNKFAGLEMQDPEVNSVEIDAENKTVSVEVRIVRNSACCNDEMKESTFNTDADIPAGIVAKMDAILAADPEAEFDAQEDGCDMLEEGGSRYQKSYYGYTLRVAIMHDGHELDGFDVSDKIEASAMDELT